MTLNPKQPRAQAIAIQDGKITAVGSNQEIHKHARKNKKVIECKNRTIIPGLVDCHAHMLEFGLSLQNLDLRQTKSIREIQEKLREHMDKNPELDWILGGRWDQEKLAEKRYPTRIDLDAVVTDKPVFLSRVCGCLSIANTKTLQLAGITKETTVKGGKIDLEEATGQPNGILRGNAMSLVWKVVPKPSREELKKACLLACRKAVEAGLTGVHWLVRSAEEMRVLQRLYSEGRLPLRVYIGVPVKLLDETLSLGLLPTFGNDMIRMGFIKVLADGSLGAHTAALKKPYSDDPEKRGMMLYTQKELCQVILKAHSGELQLGVHAIGDRAMENVLKAFEQALKKLPRQNHRHRIEHCSILNPELITRMKRLSLVASVQPHFVASDFWIFDRVGRERARWAYPFKTLLDEGVTVASGSDCPIEQISPLFGIWAAVVRNDNTEERLNVEEALKTYTVNAAYASFDEKKKGTIEAGKHADLTVLSHDLTKIPPEKIRDVGVEMVIVDGKIVYSKR
ncbi:MAG: amidohydrolase [Candidatus Bathyarchaeia archaeon]